MMTNSETKNICLFNSCKTWGGGEKWYYEIISSLSEKNYNLLIYANSKSDLYKRLQERATGQLVHISVHNLSFLNLFKIFQLSQQLKKNKINTIIIGLSSDLKLAGLAAKLAGVQQIIYRRGLANPIKNTYLNRFYYNYIVTKVIANSQEIKRCFLQSSKLIDSSKILVLYNGIDLDALNYPHKKNWSDGVKTIIGNAGRLIEEKGQKYLIDLAKILKQHNVNFLIKIAGKGKLLSSLEHYARASKVEDCIVFLDFVTDTPEFYQKIDIFVFPSVSEGFSNAVLEAMAYGKPVVAFNVSSIPELVEDNKTGFLVPFKDVNKLAEKVMFLIKHPEVRYEMGNTAKQKVVSQFDLAKNIIKLEGLL